MIQMRVMQPPAPSAPTTACTTDPEIQINEPRLSGHAHLSAAIRNGISPVANWWGRLHRSQ